MSSAAPTRRIAVIFVTALLLATASSAALAAKVSFRDGGYGPRESWVKNHTSASVNLRVTKDGTSLTSKGTGLSCENNGMAPLTDSSGIEMTVLLPHAIAISKSGKFSFKGIAKVSAYEDQTSYPITTQFSFSGQLTKGTITPLKTIAARGTVSDNYCLASTAKRFKLEFDPDD